MDEIYTILLKDPKIGTRSTREQLEVYYPTKISKAFICYPYNLVFDILNMRTADCTPDIMENANFILNYYKGDILDLNGLDHVLDDILVTGAYRNRHNLGLILRMRYEDHKSLNDIADFIHGTDGYVSQLLVRARSIIRKFYMNDILAQYDYKPVDIGDTIYA